jgi:hypothetical protein
MDDAYHEYFAGAFEALPERVDHSIGWLESSWGVDRYVAESAIAALRDSVEAAAASVEAETGHVLRSDAKWFLLLVFSQLMLQPVLAVRREPPDALLSQAAADIMQIARVGAERVSEREVSSHVLVDALSDRWEDLELTRAHHWE